MMMIITSLNQKKNNSKSNCDRFLKLNTQEQSRESTRRMRKMRKKVLSQIKAKILTIFKKEGRTSNRILNDS